MKYWAPDVKVDKEMLEDMAAGTEYYELKGIELNSSDLKKNLFQTKINLVKKSYMEPSQWDCSGTVGFKKENDGWKITEFDYRGKWPWTSQRLISKPDLQPFSSDELNLMRNEIYARHGWIFRRPDLRNYFESQPWYRPRSDNAYYSNRQVEAELSPIERRNLQIIVSRENALRR